MDAYQRYGPALLRKAQRMLFNSEDAKDVVQAVFLEFLQREESGLSLPLLYRAVTSRCLNLLRDRRNRERLLRLAEPVRAPVRSSCEERVLGLEVLLQLMQGLDGVASEVMIYRYLDDMTQEEIAQLTGFSRKTVGKRLQQVRERARRLLEAEFESEEES